MDVIDAGQEVDPIGGARSLLAPRAWRNVA